MIMLGRLHGQNLARACLRCTANLPVSRVSSSTDFGRRTPRVGGIFSASSFHNRSNRCALALALHVEDAIGHGSMQTSSKVARTGLTFQEAVVQLQNYWSSVGCTLWQPHNSEVTPLCNRNECI